MSDESLNPLPDDGEVPTEETGELDDAADPLAPDADEGRARLPHIRRIGAYTLMRVIASGGMGTVYRAKQEHPNRLVALKLMRPGLASAEAMHRFQREADLLGRMQHPNIAQVYESGTHEHDGMELPYFAMEYIPGAKPITIYAEENKLSLEQRLDLFASVCDAVDHGHQRGVIHRDLKPGNVLVDQSGRPKVIDFGIARAIDADHTATMQTGTGQLMGTLGYMAPEQLAGQTHMIGARSDVYSLGVLLYELLCSQLPHAIDRTPLQDAVRVVQEQDPTRPSSINHTLRGDLETIILTALEKDPARRYQSASELKQDLERWMRGETIVARKPTITYLIATRLRRFSRRHHVAAVVLVALMIATLGSAVGYPLLYGHGPLGGWLNQTYIDLLGATMPAPAALRELEHVRIIRLTDETFSRVPELAEQLDMPEVTLDDLRSLRRLHGRMMERLAEAGVSTVIWDFRVIGETPHDDGLVRGIDALRDADAGVVFVTSTWKGDPDLTDADINPRVLAHPHVRRGRARARVFSIGCELDVMAQRGQYEVPSLILAGFSSHYHPSGRIRYSLDHPWRRRSHVTCYTSDDPERPHIERIKHHFELPLSGLVDYTEPDTGLLPGDQTGAILLSIPTDEVLHRASMEYADVFELQPDELRTRLEGKPVLIADYREGIDMYEYRRRTLFGGDMIATGLETLFRGGRGIIRWEWMVLTIPVIFAAALIGACCSIIAGGHTRRTIVLSLAAIVLVIAACVIAYPVFRFVLNPVIPVIVLAAAALIGAAVLRWRSLVPV